MKNIVNTFNKNLKYKRMFGIFGKFSKTMINIYNSFFSSINKEKISAKKKSINTSENDFYNLEKYDELNLYKEIPNSSKFKQKMKIPSVTLVRTVEEAKYALDVLLKNKNRYHAWDTETIDVNIKEVSPVGNGKVLCASCFIGPDVDFGNGPRLFIDNYGDSLGLINIFKDYFEDEKYLKIWHNYGFDRHILFNHGINVK